jgi:Bacterial Ig-like domain (group 3)
MRSNSGRYELRTGAEWRQHAVTLALAATILLSLVAILGPQRAGAAPKSGFEFWTASAQIRNETPLEFRPLDKTKTEMTNWQRPPMEIRPGQIGESVVRNTSLALGHGLAQIATYGLYDQDGNYVAMMAVENGIDCLGAIAGLYCTDYHRWQNVWESPMAGSFKGNSIHVEYQDGGPATDFHTNFVFSLSRSQQTRPGSAPPAHVNGYSAHDVEPKSPLKLGPWGWTQETTNRSPFRLTLATKWNSQGTNYLNQPPKDIASGSQGKFLYDNWLTGHGPQSFAVYNAYDPRTNAYVGSVVTEAQTDCEAVGKVDGIPATCLVWHVASFAVAAGIPTVFLDAHSDTMGIPPVSLIATTAVFGDMQPPPPEPTTTTTTEPVRVETTTKLSAQPTESRLAGPVRLTAVVGPTAPVGTVPTGSVEFTDGTRSLGRVALVGGGQQAQATLEVGDLELGHHTITAVYGGDPTHVTSRAAVPFEVRQPIPVLHVTPSANPAAAGAPVTYRISVVTGLPALPQGEVIVAVSANPKNRFSVTLAGGQASGVLPSPLAPGVHELLASWLEKPGVTGASTTVDQRVLGSAPTTTSVTATTDRPQWGQTIDFTATVATSSGAPVSGGTVNFAVDDKPYGKPIALVNGKAVTKPAPFKLDLGRYPVTATFEPGSAPPSDTFTSSQGSVNGGVIVQPSPTVLQLYSSDSQSTVGDAVTIWVTVTGVGGAADGSVVFGVDDRAGAGNLVTLVNGSGSFTVAPNFLKAGSHTITAQYIPADQHFLYSKGSIPQDVVPRASPGT